MQGQAGPSSEGADDHQEPDERDEGAGAGAEQQPPAGGDEAGDEHHHGLREDEQRDAGEQLEGAAVIAAVEGERRRSVHTWRMRAGQGVVTSPGRIVGSARRRPSCLLLRRGRQAGRG